MAGRAYRAPGIYEGRRDAPPSSLALGESGIPAFLGLARRGPLEVPIRITSFDDFKHQFGRPVEGSYLSDALYGYFVNGGKVAHVIRIAHERGDKGEIAQAASYTALDKSGNPSLIIEASNEGSWGNEIQIEIKAPEEKVQTYLTFDLEEGQNRAIVKSARGFERGTLVRIYDGTKEHYVTLTDVESKVLRWKDQEAAPFIFKSSDLTYIEPVEFDLFVREGSKREAFRSLSLAYSSERHPERLTGETSLLIKITVLEGLGPLADRIPVPVGPVRLSNGQDGLEYVTPADFIGMNEGPGHRYGLAALEESDDIDVIVAPDVVACAQWSDGFRGRRDIEAVQDAILRHCEMFMDRFAILDMPFGFDTEKALAWRLRYDSHFGAFYYPWINVETAQGLRLMPPSGHIAGVIARCDRAVGPHHVPANEVLQGVASLEYPIDEDVVGYLTHHQVNPIRTLPNRGVRIWGARTVSSRKQWRYISVRRVMNAVRRAVYLGTQWVVFEPNDPKLWKRIEGQLKYFLAGLYVQGYFAGESAEDAFWVKCDSETNPPERRAAGELIAEIGIAPVRPAEFLSFQLQQQLPEGGV